MRVLREEGCLARIPPLRRALDALSGAAAARALAGALALVLLIHAVETAKFLRGWLDYRDQVRALATGTAADPELGAPFFVSSKRIGAATSRLAWFSTTPYLSALVADFRPTRIVVDPTGKYFWITCAIATANAARTSPVPAETREMIRAYTCAHQR